MKNILYIYITLILVSCSNVSNKESNGVDKVLRNESILEIPALEDTKQEFTYQHLTEQKLQDYYDLSLLRKLHPEFKEDIKKQLGKLSKDTLYIADLTKTVEIKNVQLIGEIMEVSDSVQRFRLNFDIISHKAIKKDSIIATIISKKILLDTNEVLSTKVIFSKN